MPRPRLFYPWVALAAICCVLMWLGPGQETIPYHVAFLGLAAAYGLEPWTSRRALSGVAGLTVASGFVLIFRAATGALEWQETAEIPLMGGLMLLMVWHVRRRQEALNALAELRKREAARAAQRERMSRMNSHDLRTPVTIALGHVDLLLHDETDPHRSADLRVVAEELDRIVLVTDRLIRMMRIPDQNTVEPVDLDALLEDVRLRWSVVADRDWQVRSSAGIQLVCAERIRTCLDTLVENSVRYTGQGEVIRLVSSVDGAAFVLGVEDGGVGMDPQLCNAINAGTDADAPSVGNEWQPHDEKSQSGLGLGLVRIAVEGHGGRLQVGRSPERGARVVLVIPGSPKPPPDVAPAVERRRATV